MVINFQIWLDKNKKGGLIMKAVFNESTKTSEIVTRFPKASNILKEYQIDFCCNGNRPISEAIKENGLNEEEVLSKLNFLYFQAVKSKKQEQEMEWDNYTYKQLIDYVVTKHHTFLYETLPEISNLITKVCRKHVKTQPELVGVFELFHHLKMELEHHLIREEIKVFPRILSFEKSKSPADLKKAQEKVKILEAEHDSAGEILQDLREITNNYVPPKKSCKLYTLTYQKLEELEADLFQHIYLENNIMFLRLDKEIITS